MKKNQYEQWSPQPEQQHMQQEVDPVTGGLVPPATPPDAEAFGTGVEETQPPGSTITVTDPPQPPPNGAQPERTFTAEDMAKARREEKDKLYGEIESTKERLKRLEDEREAERKVAKDAADAAAAEAEAARIAEMTAIERAEEVEKRLNDRIEQIEQERAQERALNEREQEFLRLQQYIGEQRTANQEDIVPELLDLITGGTREEVDNSVSTLVERSASILANITAAQDRAPAPAAPPRGASITAPPVGPADTQQDQRSFTADEIAAMPMSEYAKYRERLLQSNARTVQERGLYQ